MAPKLTPVQVTFVLDTATSGQVCTTGAVDGGCNAMNVVTYCVFPVEIVTEPLQVAAEVC